jgi:hypothetical protein
MNCENFMAIGIRIEPGTGMAIWTSLEPVRSIDCRTGIDSECRAAGGWRVPPGACIVVGHVFASVRRSASSSRILSGHCSEAGHGLECEARIVGSERELSSHGAVHGAAGIHAEVHANAGGGSGASDQFVSDNKFGGGNRLLASGNFPPSPRVE